ncbi:MAG: hypothetical protein AAFY26_26145, partial [Cyanobacteria bacterium J06638_22]
MSTQSGKTRETGRRLISTLFSLGTATIVGVLENGSAIAWQPDTGNWQPVSSRREDYGKIKVVWLQGTPYEMGYQHGTLLRD